MSEVSFTITLRGTGQGLESGRLSIDAFSHAFKDLLLAYRAIAAGFVSSAGTSDIDARGKGRKPRFVERMDLEIDRVTHDSPTAIRLVCSVPPGDLQNTEEMFATEIVRRSSTELLESVYDESKGRPRNKYVRRFLAHLPKGTAHQVWDLYEGSKLVKSYDIGSMQLPVAEPDMESPGFVSLTGRVTGVHFSPGYEVRLKGSDDEATLKATAAQVDAALDLRHSDIAALGLQRHGRMTLLWLRARVGRGASTREKRNEYFSKRWDGVLRRLGS